MKFAGIENKICNNKEAQRCQLNEDFEVIGIYIRFKIEKIPEQMGCTAPN